MRKTYVAMSVLVATAVFFYLAYAGVIAFFNWASGLPAWLWRMIPAALGAVWGVRLALELVKDQVLEATDGFRSPVKALHDWVADLLRLAGKDLVAAAHLARPALRAILIMGFFAALVIGSFSTYQRETTAAAVVANFGQLMEEKETALRKRYADADAQLLAAHSKISDLQAVQDSLKQQIADLTRDNGALKSTVNLAASAGIKVPSNRPR